jgi:hypothetical protein
MNEDIFLSRLIMGSQNEVPLSDEPHNKIAINF